jgi:tRNA 2-thiouridine synthesizing protein A
MADQTLDAKGLNCPLPILRAKKALTALPAGATLEVLATAFSRTTGHELVEQSVDGNVYRFVLKRKA